MEVPEVWLQRLIVGGGKTWRWFPRGPVQIDI